MGGASSVGVAADTPEGDYQTFGYRCGDEGTPGDNIGYLLKRADQAPYSYETLHDLVCALSAAVSFSRLSPSLFLSLSLCHSHSPF